MYPFSFKIGEKTWLPVYKRVHQSINAIIFKFVKNPCPYYLHCTPLNAEQNQEVTLPSSRFLNGKLVRGRKAINTLVPLYGSIYSDL